MENLTKRWNTKYPSCEPRAEALKETYKDRWVRFYVLEDAKRYPDNTHEQLTILNRHNAILNELKPGKSLFVLLCDWTNSSVPSSDDIEAHLKDGERYWVSLREDPTAKDSEFIMYRHLYVAERRWSNGALDDILTAVSKDETSGVIFAPTDLRWLYHPYDGGVDIIGESVSKKDALKEHFKDWVD